MSHEDKGVHIWFCFFGSGMHTHYFQPCHWAPSDSFLYVSFILISLDSVSLGDFRALSGASGTFDMDPLFSILADAGVQDTFIDKLRDDGWNQELFAMSAPSLAKFDEEIRDMLGDLFDITTSVQRSALRLAWSRCQPTAAPLQTAIPSAGAAMVETTPSQSSWSETYPPKLTPQVVADLKQRFRKNYPAEVLLPETTPSIRLLSLIHHQKSKNDYKWVPWKYRLSQAKSDELTTARPNRMAKAEGLQLHSLLLDSPPELTIENGALGIHALRQMFEAYSYAMAMCEVVHLATMKQYFLKFINLMTAKYESETGLRNPTILESQSADKALMGIAFELVLERQWTVDDAIHEVTFIRAEINTLLQARPRLPKQYQQRIDSGVTKGSGKAPRPSPYTKGKSGKAGGKSSGKSGGKIAWVTEAVINGTKKQLCMRFQTGKCDMGANCRFHHGCAYPTASGEACNKSHGALMHDKTPH